MVNSLLPFILVLINCTQYTQAFHQIPSTTSAKWFSQTNKAFLIPRSLASPRSRSRLACSDKHNPPPPGDKIREATGKRPSLHPTIINALSEALHIRSDPASFPNVGPMEVPPPSPSPSSDSDTTAAPTALQVAIAAGDLATEAITRRTLSSKAVEGDEASATFTQEECQLVAGRVVGVVMRFDLLEGTLADKVRNVAWVKKYGEEATFGLLTDELQGDSSGGTRRGETVDLRLKDDPLLRMCRAECLYALFLLTVEAPAMEKMGKSSSSGETMVDFLDSDRLEVLL